MRGRQECRRAGMIEWRRAMGKIELSKLIAAPMQDVFVFFVPQRMPYWYGAEMNSCFEMQEGAADFRAGLKVRISGHLARKSVSHTAVVTAFEYGRLLEWQFQDSYGVRGKERWELARAPGDSSGGTIVKFVNEYALPGRIGRAMDWLLTRHAITRRNREYLERLARLAERRAR
jgi:uncharacterized protein YndB with AHSA1/START domain